jgi:hypothetical protein
MKDIRDLKGAGESVPIQNMRGFPGQILSLEKNRPRRSLEVPTDDIEQRRFPRSVGTYDSVALLLGNREINPGQDLQSREVLMDVFDVQIIGHDHVSSA